jgi:L-alanine-DL-glutamate epimerase-like enolase superfamily enzyme
MHTDARRWQLTIRPADADDALAQLQHPIPLCADESPRTRADLDRLDGKYQAINIKLDKAGGLTEALALAEEAKWRGLRIMVGGVVSTSLGIAPALLVAQQAVSSISTGRCTWRSIAGQGCGTTAARSIRPTRSCGAGRVDSGA